MLTNEQIEANKKEYSDLLNEIATLNPSRAKGVTNLLNWLNEQGFFTDPASTKYHQAYKGGLCEHSLQVYKHLNKLIEEYQIKDIPRESVILTALLHDLCKTGMYKEWHNGYYAKDDIGDTIFENGKPKLVKENTFKVKDNQFEMGHAEKSLFYITQFFQVSAIEYQAILFHMGYCDLSSYRGISNTSNAFEQNTLAFLLHTSDMLSTYLPNQR